MTSLAEQLRFLVRHIRTRPTPISELIEPLDQAATALEFQKRVQVWMLDCFGAEISGDRMERNHRFLEESLELVQSLGCSKSEALQLVEYVYARPIGVASQEVGGVVVTLAALCSAWHIDMAGKPKHGPLP